MKMKQLDPLSSTSPQQCYGRVSIKSPLEMEYPVCINNQMTRDECELATKTRVSTAAEYNALGRRYIHYIGLHKGHA